MNGGFLKRLAITTAVAFVVLAVIALAFVYSGLYNVAATTPHSGPVRWLLSTAQERSVRFRGGRVGEKPPFDSAMVALGFDHYREMCVECHGAPGVEPGELGRGLNPEPPDLAEEARELGDGELFWVIKHGLKFTGMPGFGPTHADPKIWAIVAFLRRLQDMTPQAYSRMVARAEASPEDGGGEAGQGHATGTPEHSH